MSDGAQLYALLCACAAGLMLLSAVLICWHLGQRVQFSSARGLCDLLDYATCADDSVIVLKNGGLMRIYELQPPDLSHVTVAQLEHVRTLTATALFKLGGGWCIQVDAVRSPDAQYLPQPTAQNAVVQKLDALRAHSFAQDKSFHTRFYLTLTYHGSSQTKQALTALMLQDKELEGHDVRARTLALIENFTERTDAAVSTLRLTMGVTPLTLQSDHEHAALSFIMQCLYGKDIKLRYPQHALYLDALLSCADLTTGLTPKLGDKYIACVAIDGLPSESFSGMLNTLAALPCTARFHTRFICFDDLQSAFLLERYRRFWTQKSRGILSQIFNLPGRVNTNALAKVEEIDSAKAALDSRQENFGSYTALIVLQEEDFAKLQQVASLCVQQIEALGFGARIETVNSLEAFLGALPGHSKENLRRPLLSQSVLTDLLPLSQPWEGEREAPSPLIGHNAGPLMQVRTAGKGRFYLNLHQKDVGNTIVIGPPGAGKSVLLQALMVNFLRYPQARIYAFDKGYSFYALASALGGEHVVLGDVQSAFCPLQQLDKPGELNFGISFCELLFRLGELTLNPQQRLELTQTLQLMSSLPAAERTLSDLHLLLSSTAMKDALAPYTLLGNARAILDSTQNLSFTTDLTVFECGSLFEQNLRYSLPLLKQLFHLIELSFDGRPIMLVLDEAWMMLRDETFALELLKWFKTLRKHNVLVVLATQSLTDLASSSLFEIFLECAQSRIFLPNFDAQSVVLAPIYQQLGVNTTELAALVQAEPKRDYLFKKGAHSVIFDLALTPEELRLMSFAGDHCKSQVDALMAAYGPLFFMRPYINSLPANSDLSGESHAQTA